MPPINLRLQAILKAMEPLLAREADLSVAHTRGIYPLVQLRSGKVPRGVSYTSKGYKYRDIDQSKLPDLLREYEMRQEALSAALNVARHNNEMKARELGFKDFKEANDYVYQNTGRDEDLIDRLMRLQGLKKMNFNDWIGD